MLKVLRAEKGLQTNGFSSHTMPEYQGHCHDIFTEETKPGLVMTRGGGDLIITAVFQTFTMFHFTNTHLHRAMEIKGQNAKTKNRS